MSVLSVYHESRPEQPLKVLTHLEDIAATLAEVGVQLERWDASAPVAAGASQEDVIAAYRPQIDRLMAERGYVTVDVISVSRIIRKRTSCAPNFLTSIVTPRTRCASFAGRGLFTLHIEDMVYAVLCEKNDLISVPAGTRHWFDMGEQPSFVAIRLFNNPDGWTAQFTGERIADQFPRLDD